MQNTVKLVNDGVWKKQGKRGKLHQKRGERLKMHLLGLLT